MFGRIKRFFIALRVLRRRAREERAIRKELNLNSMGYLARTLVDSQPRAKAQADTMMVYGKVILEDAKKVIEESRVQPTPVSRTPSETEAILKAHEEKFRS